MNGKDPFSDWFTGATKKPGNDELERRVETRAREYVLRLKEKALGRNQPLMSDSEFQQRQRTGQYNAEYFIEDTRRHRERDRLVEMKHRREMALENGPEIEKMLEYIPTLLDNPVLKAVYESYKKIQAEDTRKQRR